MVVLFDTSKRKFLPTYWTGNLVGSRAGVDISAKRKIPVPALNKSFHSATSHLIDEGNNVLSVRVIKIKGYKQNAFQIQ
jgi:hypothetical protein